MKIPVNGYQLTAPLLGGQFSEAEALGAAVWLWMHSEQHRDIPLSVLPTLLLPAIKHQQFVIASRDDKPMFFLSWAWMDEKAEQRYLTGPGILVQPQDWTSGNRLWFRDWVAPFGDQRVFRRIVGGTLFPHLCGRALYHKGAERGQRVLQFRGDDVTQQQFRLWQQNTPLVA